MAAVQNDIEYDRKSLLEGNDAFSKKARAYPDQHHLANRRRRHGDEKNWKSRHYGLAHYQEFQTLTSHGFPDRNSTLHRALQEQCDDLDPLATGLSEPAYCSPCSHDAARETPNYDRRGRRPYRDPSPYDAVDVWPESILRSCRPSRSAPPYNAADESFIFDDVRHSRTHRHRSGNGRVPLHSDDVGLSDVGEASFRNMNLGPRNSHSQRGLSGSHDTGHEGFESLAPRLRCGAEPGLDSNDVGLAIPSRRHHCNLREGRWRATGHQHTDNPFRIDSKHHDTKHNFREAHGHRPLRPCITRCLPYLNFQSVHDAEINGMNRAHERLKAQFKLQEAQDDARDNRFRRQWRVMNQVAGTQHPVDKVFDADFECSGRHSCDMPSRPHRSRNVQRSPPRKSTIQDIEARAKLATYTNRPYIVPAVAGNFPATVSENTAKETGTVPRPVCGPKGKNKIHHSTNCITSPNNSDTNTLPKPESPHNILHQSQISLRDDDFPDSSESGYDTPDDDDDSEIYPAGDDEVGNDAAAAATESFIRIRL